MLAVALVLGPCLALLTGCGGGNGQLAVSLSSTDAGFGNSPYAANDPRTFAEYKPGDDANLTVTVVNNGPDTATGVTVHVTLPPSFHYRATTGIDSSGATRTQPLDPAVNSEAPIFGLWTISAPGAAGAGQVSQVRIHFTAQVGGQPGTAQVQTFAASDTSAGQTDAVAYNLTVTAAAKLSAQITVSPTTQTRGGTVTYTVRVTNSGTGNAQDVAVLVTLPPVMTFAASVTPFAGNGTRNRGVNPIKDTLEVYYDGFLLPPTSTAGPGYVVIVFKATILGAPPAGVPLPTFAAPPPAAAGAPPGTYNADVQVTDQAGDTFALTQVAPVVVT